METPLSSPGLRSHRRASSPPTLSVLTPTPVQPRRAASTPSFCFLPCSLSELLWSARSTPTPPPRRCETEAQVAATSRKQPKAADSVPRLPFQSYCARCWEPDVWSRSTQTDLPADSSTQTEPVTLLYTGQLMQDEDSRHTFRRLLDERCYMSPFFVTVAALGVFVFILVTVSTVFGTVNTGQKADNLELLSDAFENEAPAVAAAARNNVQPITAPTAGKARGTAVKLETPKLTAKTRRPLRGASAKAHKATRALLRRPQKGVRGTNFKAKTTPTAWRTGDASLEANTTSTTLRTEAFSTPTSTTMASTTASSTTATARRPRPRIVGSRNYVTHNGHLVEVIGDALTLTSGAEESDEDQQVATEDDVAPERMRSQASPTTHTGFLEEII
ncbi:uncharacterized protein LOC144094347 isoform X2 [Amblyomma americanum]